MKGNKMMFMVAALLLLDNLVQATPGKHDIVRRLTKGRQLYPVSDSFLSQNDKEVVGVRNSDPRLNWFGNSYEPPYGDYGEHYPSYYEPIYEPDVHPSTPYEICEYKHSWWWWGGDYEVCYKY